MKLCSKKNAQTVRTIVIGEQFLFFNFEVKLKCLYFVMKPETFFRLADCGNFF